MTKLTVPERLLMGPGPSCVPKRVLDALSLPPIGHLDPAFLEILAEVQVKLRLVFGTENEATFPLPTTGGGGMEACLVSLLSPGDRAVLGVSGYFGNRMADIAERCGAKAIRVEANWGDVLSPDRMAEAIRAARPKVVAFVHAETSTGVLQPVEEIAAVARDAGALILLDCVTSLGGCPVEIDAWGIDAAWSATQKCLSAPSGLSPVTLSEAAMKAIRERKTKVQSFYLDLALQADYQIGRAGTRTYHHTTPSSLFLALHEALAITLEEGLEERFDRHLEVHEYLVQGLETLGLELRPPPERRLPMLNAVTVPEGVDDLKVRRSLLDAGIEIGGGMGELAGRIWRVGTMGESCRKENVDRLIAAFREALRAEGPGE